MAKERAEGARERALPLLIHRRFPRWVILNDLLISLLTFAWPTQSTSKF